MIHNNDNNQMAEVFEQVNEDARAIVLNYARALSNGGRIGSALFAASTQLAHEESMELVEQIKLERIMNRIAELDDQIESTDNDNIKALLRGQQESWTDRAMVLMNKSGAKFIEQPVRIESNA